MRVTIDFSKPFHQKLGALQPVLGVGSKADVIRNAVWLLEYVANAAKEGFELQLVKGNDRRSVVMPGLVPTPDPSSR